MRELKFRAWDSKDNNWLFDSPDGFSMFGEMVIMGEWGAAAWRSIADDMPNRFILLQYTGLHDKNGAEIYEGDIVRRKKGSSGHKYYVYFMVVWRDARWIFDIVKPKGRIERISPSLAELHCEIVGNIHENPELLKDQDA